VNGSFAEKRNMMEDRFLKRLRKKARKGLRGWPIATIAFYGPNLSRATKVTVGIVPSENAEVEELRAWKVDDGEIRADPRIARPGQPRCTRPPTRSKTLRKISLLRNRSLRARENAE
jgi:hypothetical protein